jgi:hypothetical protein
MFLKLFCRRGLVITPLAVKNLALPSPPDIHFDIYVERNNIREEKQILSFQVLEITNAVTSVTFVV